MSKNELIEIMNEAIGEMNRVANELNWSEPIDEGYVHVLDKMREAVKKTRSETVYIFSLPGCIFKYCPSVKICKNDGCIHPITTATP
ncbi:MAG: hypothetical protein H6636_06920 [Anaerolineales bacterium]|nr:hypothetical protein [Anaerolineales bacterium]